MRWWSIGLVACAAIVMVSCVSRSYRRARVVVKEPPAPAVDEGFTVLVDWMTGIYASEAQSKTDPEYFDIRLAMARIWHDREDGVWLYVEQAVAQMMDKPYRQRVYRLRHVGARIYESSVYELPGDPLAHAGAHTTEKPLGEMSPDDLTLMPGCGVVLRRMPDGTFAGSTLGSQCGSDFRGASYATSEVRVTEKGITSWDRGYGADHKQVWGAVKGSYVFDKTENLAP